MLLNAPQIMEVDMKHFIQAMVATVFTLISLTALAGPDASWQRALQKGNERAEQAAQAKMEAMLAQCRAPTPGQR